MSPTTEAAHTPGPRRAVKGPESGREEWYRPGCGFVIGPDGKTVVGRFPRFEDAVLDAAAPDLLAALNLLVDVLQDQPDEIQAQYKADIEAGLAAIARAEGRT